MSSPGSPEASPSVLISRSATPPNQVSPRKTFGDLSQQVGGVLRPRTLSSSSSTGRRSVSSMRSLMPLALSSHCSVASTTSSSSPPPEEVLGQALDGCFPELLVADLEHSSSVFALRRMTSGIPDPSLSSEDRFPNGAAPSSWPNRFPVSPSYHAAMSPTRSLDPIREKSPMVSFLGNRVTQQRPTQEDAAADGESLAGTDASKSAGAYSNESRDRSIFTVATSMTSSWISNLKHVPPARDETERKRSWIDPDTEDDEPDTTIQETLAPLSPRPQTPPERRRANEPDKAEHNNNNIIMTISAGRSKKCHQKAHSISAFASPSRPQRANTRPGRGRRSRSPPPPVSDDEAPPIPRRRRPRASTFQHQHDETYRKLTSGCDDPTLAADRKVYEDFMLANHNKLRRDATPPPIETVSDKPAQEPPHEPQKQEFIYPTPPASPLPSVESWLNTNADNYVLHHNDDGIRSVPLPPNVIETLRISVTCFPETMLLTSSLTVETIRSYAKKVRQPVADVQGGVSNVAASASLAGIPRKSLWKRVASYKRHGATGDSPLPRRLRSAGGLSTMGPHEQSHDGVDEETEMQPKTWDHLKNVFGGASDYICDALWAHIVAYNYISAHIPRQRSFDGACKGPESATSTTSSPSKDEIPKKAATLLGLASATAQDVQRSVHKLSGPLTGLIHRQDAAVTVPPAGRRVAAQETAMRELQAGLMRCIARLIATAKLMLEDGSRHDGPIMDLDTAEQGADVFLTRSLCEIVRLAEDESA